ncbi:MAG: MAPEG family protein [Cyanobacteria bacterium P01_A01_bin.84]
MNLLQFPISSIFLYSILIASLLIYFPFLVVGYARFQIGYDSSAPRAIFDKLPPYAKRANWAHQNSFETFIIFAVAALSAYVTGVDNIAAGIAAIAFVTARFFYSIFYILDIPIGRSLMFAIGSLSSYSLLVLSILKVSS